MAMVDYGAIAWKDGKLISTDMFTPMEDMVGWSDENNNKGFKLNGNCFAYIGDKDFTVGFYKDVMRICSPSDSCYNDSIYFWGVPFEGWRRWRDWYLIGSNSDEVEIIVYSKLENVEALSARMIDITSATANITLGEEFYLSEQNGQIIL